MDILAKFDWWLITKIYEPLGWYFGWHFGRDNFALARICCLVGWLIQGCATIAFSYSTMGLGAVWSMHPTNGLPLLFVLLAWFAQDNGIRRNARKVRQKPEVINGEKASCGLRLFLIVAAILICLERNGPLGLVDKVGVIIYMIFIISAFYLSACNPMPPTWVPSSKLARQSI